MAPARWTLNAVALASFVASPPAPSPSHEVYAAQEKVPIATSGSERRAVLTRARVWEPSDIASKDLLAGPPNRTHVSLDETVTCTFVDKGLSGRTPKFLCRLDPDDDVKVKHGRDNGEVYAEVASTRLLWALGFGADRTYPVRVVCRECEGKVDGGVERRDGARSFDPAVIEWQLPGRDFTSSGWSWNELEKLDEVAGGATRAERDALTLLAVFIQHTDSKRAQQRIVCRDEGTDGAAATSACEHPFMYIDDVGMTFGRANRRNSGDTGSMNLVEWSRTPVWKKPQKCTGNLPRSATGTLDDPTISEEGRQFLADLLQRLSDQQIHHLFEAARVQYRLRDPKDESSGLATVDEWVAAFKAKREQIVTVRCPAE